MPVKLNCSMTVPSNFYPPHLKTDTEKLTYLEGKYLKLLNSKNCGLPDELLQHLCTYLTENALKNFALGCKHYYAIANEEISMRRAQKIGAVSIRKFQKICDQLVKNSYLQPRINLLDLSGCCYNEKELFYITKFGGNLERLKLSSLIVLHHNAIEKISESCPKIKELILEGATADDFNLNTFFKENSSIRKIHIDTPSARLTEEGINGIIPYAKNLKSFSINGARSIDASRLANFIKNCSQLEELIISRIPGVDDQFFCSLKSLPYLKNLIVYEIRQFSDLGIKALNEAPFNLHEALFHGENCTVSEDGFIDFIKKSLNIQKLSFHLDCNLSDRFLKAVGDHSLSLNSLYCFYSDKITDDGIEYVVKNCTFLKHLALGNCKLLTDQSLHSITEHRPELENLYIRNAHQITIGGLSKLGNKCTQLTVLDIHGTKISEKDFCSLPELFPLLVSLEVSRSINFTIDALKMIVENCKNLNTLFHSIYISNSDLEMFRTQYPKVKLEYAVD